MEVSIRYNDEVIRRVEEKLKRIVDGSKNDDSNENMTIGKVDMQNGIHVPEKLHGLIESLINDKAEKNPIAKKTAKKALENLEIVKQVEELVKTKEQSSSAFVNKLKCFESVLFKDITSLQKEVALTSEGIALTVERNKVLANINELQKEKVGFLNKPKKNEELKSLNKKVEEINIVIQNKGETLSVKEFLPSHKKSLESSFNATMAVSDVVRKTLETVSQIEHIPKREMQLQLNRADVLQPER